ncbi:hypothetical protein [Actinoplanes rectilineatus]|uniref:hypothetical protein n=1 Tax=Actinoplanes rectilineatus TaxID=113571 RepID=UPI0005F2ECC7|nr:hypothetical protein [Actinoplanes rectilineatus]
MSHLIELAVRALSTARAATRATGHEAPAVEAAHLNATGVRAQLSQDRAEETADRLSDADPGDDGLLGEIRDWFLDHLS